MDNPFSTPLSCLLLVVTAIFGIAHIGSISAQPVTTVRFQLNVLYLLNSKETNNYDGIICRPNLKPVLDLAQRHSNERYSFDIEWAEMPADRFEYCINLGRPFQLMGALSDLLGTISLGVLNRQIHAIVGPPCRYEFQMAAELAAYLQIPIITGSAETIPHMTDFPTAVTSNYSPMSIWAGFVTFCKKVGWTDVFIVYDDSGQGTLLDPEERINYANGLSQMLALRKVNSTVARHMQLSDVDINLRLLKRSARVGVIISNTVVLRSYMVTACNISMCNGDYAFFTLQIFKDEVMTNFTLANWQVDENNSTDATNSTNQLATLALDAIHIIAVFDFRSTSVYQDFKYKFNEQNNDTIPITDYTMFYYDAVMLMASNVDRLVKGNRSVFDWDTTSPEFFYREEGQRAVGFTPDVVRTMTTAPWYEGVTGTLYYSNSTARAIDTNIYDYNPTLQRFVVAENFTALRNQTKTIRPLRYPGSKPPSKPVCGYDEANAGCNDLKTDEIIAIIAGSTCALVALISAALARRKYTKEKAASHSWMIKFEDVQYPRDVQEWLRRRYTIIDDGAGGLAVAEAVRMAKKAVSGKSSRGQLAPDDEVRRTTLGPGRTISHKHGIVNSQPVTIRYCHKDLVPIVPRVLREAKLIRSLKSNDNIMQFVGASVEWKKVAIFYEYCSKGTLQDLLANTQLKLDWIMRISITTDILRGLAFIHQSPLEAHGRLTSKCCYIDARFVLKIGDHGLPSFFSLNADETEELKETGDIWQMLLWTAPEHIGMMLGQSYVHKPTPTSEPLRISMLERTPGFWARCFKKNNSIYPGIIDREAYVATSLKLGTKQGDIYSFSIIFTEIITLAKPYGMYLPHMTPEEIVTKVRDRLSQVDPFRPDITEEDCAHPEMLHLLERCWNQSYNHRPSITQVRAKMKDIGDDMGLSGKTASVMDIILNQMEEQAGTLQATIAEKTKIMEAEKTKTFQLFAQILPRTIAERLRHEEVISAELYDIVTVLICDVENFGDIITDCSPTETIDFATDLFNYYETNIAEFECINVDFYNTLVLVASGLPVRNGIFNAREIGRLALSLLFKTITFRPRHDTSERLRLKMAVHTGPVFAGIVGELNPRYSVFGETIFVTHRLLAVTKGFSIRCSASAQNLMETFGSFVLSRMDEIFIKGKGMQPTYQLFGENASPAMQRLEADFRAVYPDSGL